MPFEEKQLSAIYSKPLNSDRIGDGTFGFFSEVGLFSEVIL